ncbi:MAG: apolipoprotein N-acyltransferase [Rubellimicrobium sp.]|nr:apolipoprotein N-acyltransferase [Rubellimicrobium sp.]
MRRWSRDRLGRAAMFLAGGGLMALGQAPWGLWPVTLAVLVALFWQGLGPQRLWPAFRQGWVLGLGYFLVSLHWIVEPFLVDLPRHGWMAPFALVLMTGGLALFWGAAFAAARWLAPRGSAAAALVLTLTLAEVLRSFVFTGFPWALIGHVWIDTGAGQAAALVGAHGLTLMTLAVAAVTGRALRRRAWLILPLPGLALAALWLWLAPGPPAAPDPDAPVIRIVQPNVPQAEKWSYETLFDHIRLTIDLSRPDPSGPRPAIVLWPETAIPWLLDEAPDLFETAIDATGGVPLILGVQRREGSRFFNSLALIGADAQVEAVYDKVHLVPFGEFVPFGEVMARFGIHGLAASEGGGFTRGADASGTLMSLPGIGPALPLICYEGIFAPIVNRAAGRPRVLLLVTNDAWFGNLSGPYQHLVQGRLRAIEQGVPMVRAANTGISAMIDGRGRVLADLPLNTHGAIDTALPPVLPPTIYARWGDLPVGAVLFLLGLWALSARWRARP